MAETLEIEPNAKGFQSLADAFFRSPAYDERYKKVRLKNLKMRNYYSYLFSFQVTYFKKNPVNSVVNAEVLTFELPAWTSPSIYLLQKA